MITTLKGTLLFEPSKFSKKHKMETWRTVAIVQFAPTDLLDYCAWFIKKKFGVDLVKPMRGAHLTFISDEVKSKGAFDRIGKEFQKNKIEISFNPMNIKSNGVHWWIEVDQNSCRNLDSFRTMCGLKKYKFKYHITIGYCKKEEEHISQKGYNILKKYYYD